MSRLKKDSGLCVLSFLELSALAGIVSFGIFFLRISHCGNSLKTSSVTNLRAFSNSGSFARFFVVKTSDTHLGPFPPTEGQKRSNSPHSTTKIPIERSLPSNDLNLSVGWPLGTTPTPDNFAISHGESALSFSLICLAPLSERAAPFSCSRIELIALPTSFGLGAGNFA